VILPEEGETLILDRRPDAAADLPRAPRLVSHLGDPSATAETEPLVMAEVESADAIFSASYCGRGRIQDLLRGLPFAEEEND